jgi:hypothetical protein
LLASVFVGLAAALSCDDGDGPSFEDGWSQDFAATACTAMYQGCECPTGLPWSSAKVCEQSLGPSTRTAQNRAKTAELVFDAECAERHIDAIGALECETIEDVDLLADGVSCQIYHGDKQFGDACELFAGWISDCAQGLVCAYSGRRCAQPEHPFVDLSEGAPCADENNLPLGACPATQKCDFGTKVCATPTPLGDPCSGENAPCVDGWCDAGTCAPRKEEGAACKSGLECTSASCRDEACTPDVPTPLACFATAL